MSKVSDLDELFDVEHTPSGGVMGAGTHTTNGQSEAIFYRPPAC